MTEIALSLISFINKQNIFQRNKKPLFVKAVSLIDYIFHRSYRKVARKLSAFYVPITKSSIQRYVKKFQSRVRVSIQPKERTMIAVDETVVKINGKRCFIWAAVDIFSKELIAFDVSRGRSSLDSLVFLARVKARCKGELPIVLVDKGPWYPESLSRLGFDYMHYTFSIRNAVERFFGLVKDRTRLFYNNINNCNDGTTTLIEFMRMFAYWYKELR